MPAGCGSDIVFAPTSTGLVTWQAAAGYTALCVGRLCADGFDSLIAARSVVLSDSPWPRGYESESRPSARISPVTAQAAQPSSGRESGFCRGRPIHWLASAASADGKTSDGTFGTACRLFETPPTFRSPAVRKALSRKNGGEATGERAGENRWVSRVGEALTGDHDHRADAMLALPYERRRCVWRLNIGTGELRVVPY